MIEIAAGIVLGTTITFGLGVLVGYWLAPRPDLETVLGTEIAKYRAGLQ